MAEAAIDVELAAHLGLFRNVDLLEKGVYAVRLSLAYGRQDRKIVPTGLFSAPSTLGSHAGEHAIPATRFISGCEVSEEESSCTSRSFMVRYRGETHELNDGVFWRMTLPSVLVPLGNTAAIVAVPDVLFLTLDLLFSPLNSEDTDAAKLYETPDIYLPENMSYTVLSTQRIALQQFSSGVHEYFSITFDDRNYTLLDLMVHCCITAVHYNNVAFYPELQPPRRRLPPDLIKNGTTSTLKDAGPTAVSDGTGGSQIRRTRVSTTIDTSNSQQTGSKSAPKSSFFRLPALFLNPEKILFGDHHPSDQSSTQRNSGSDVNSDSYVTKVTVNPITMASAFKRRVSSSVSSSMIGSKLPSGTAEEASDSIAAALDPEDNQETASVVSSPDIDDNLTVDTSTTTTAGEEDEGAASEELTCSGDSSTVSPKDCSSGFVAPSAERIAEVYDLYTAPIIRNYEDAVKAIQSLLHAASELESSAEFADSNVQNRLLSHSVVEGSDKDDAVVPTTDSITEEVEPYACLLKTRRLKHIEALVNLANHYSKGSDINGASVSTPTNRTPRSKIALNRSLTVVLHEFLDRGHEQLALQWSLFTATLRRLLYPLRQLLYPKYLAEQSIFWKQQMISHTRPYAGSHVIASAKDSEMWDILAQHITVEREHERQKLLRPLQHPRHHLGRGRYARGLHVFDWQLFRLPSRLPYLLTETYSQNDIGPISSTLTNSERLSNSSDTSYPAAGDQDEAARAEERLLQSPNTSIYERRQSHQHMRGHSNSIAGSNSDDYICRRQPVHVIVLQHGFLGSAFDMRLLSHALQALLSPTEAPRKPASTHNNKRASNNAANRLKGALFSDEEMTPSSSCKSQKIPPKSRNHHQEQEQTSPTVATAPSHKVLVHCCTSNEGTPSSLSGIREMGQRFADELVAFLREKAPSLLFTPPASFHYDPLKSDDLFSCPDRISFIGHSLGGLIIRSALQEDSLQPLRDKLHVFMSLATPHVGNLFSDSSLVSTGMWALAKFKNYRCLQELVLEDGGKDLNLVPDVLARENGGSNGSSNGSSSGSGRKGEGATSGTEEQNQERRRQQLAQREARITTQAPQLVGQSSLLYRLSLPVVPLSCSSSGSTSTSDSASGGGVRVTRNALRDFRHVLLVSSPKDQYVSTYSARIQVSPKVEQDANKGGFFGVTVRQMIESLALDVLQAPQIVRITVVNNEEDITLQPAPDATINSVNPIHEHLHKHSRSHNFGETSRDSISSDLGEDTATFQPRGHPQSRPQQRGVTIHTSPSTSASTSTVRHAHHSNVAANMAGDLALLSTPTSTSSLFFLGDVNTAIGRSAHICYLDNAVVAHQLIVSALPYLQG